MLDEQSGPSKSPKPYQYHGKKEDDARSMAKASVETFTTMNMAILAAHPGSFTVQGYRERTPGIEAPYGEANCAYALLLSPDNAEGWRGVGPIRRIGNHW